MRPAPLTARLRRVCSNLSEAQVAALVQDIADVTLKYEMRTGAAAEAEAEARRLIRAFLAAH